MMLMPMVVSLLFFSRATKEDFQSAQPWTTWLLAGAAILALFQLWLIFFCRLEITAEYIRHVGLFERENWKLEWSQVNAYTSDTQGDWRIESGGKKYPVAMFKQADLHIQMLIHAVAALNGIPVRQKHLPPKESFLKRWPFEPLSFLGPKGYLLGSITGLLLTKPYIALPGLLILLLLFILQESFNRISITDLGITQESFRGTKDILWKDIDAVFRERRPYSRGFTIVAGDDSIFVPPKLCENAELVRKLLFSLPEGTLLVNFKGKIPRRPRRRIRKRLPLRRPKQEALQPTF